MAHSRDFFIYSDPVLLENAGVTNFKIQPDTFKQIALAKVSEEKSFDIIKAAHEMGRCGGFESLGFRMTAESGLHFLKRRMLLDSDPFFFPREPQITRESEIADRLSEIRTERVEEMIELLSQFPDRYARGAKSNDAVNKLYERLHVMIEKSPYKSRIKLNRVDHRAVPQKSLHVHIEGTEAPEEIVVLGGHLDSIRSLFGGHKPPAPGADDNASGVSNIIEALRVLLSLEKAPKRSIDIFLYGGEELGLLGSSDIARRYKHADEDVIAVMQLDMTLFPGSGEFVLGSIADYTSKWLRQYILKLNELYLGHEIVESKCGYGCSDHASWYRQGYPTVFPFESHNKDMNKRIHTKEDILDERGSIEHSTEFSKLALAYLLTLANSDERESAF